MHVRDAPESVDQRPRWRWVPSLCLGAALGGLIGCVATFAVLEQSKRAQAKNLAAKRFNLSTVLNAVPGTGGVTITADRTEYLGTYSNGWLDSGSAANRHIRFQGTLPEATDSDEFCTQLEGQIIIELGRHAAYLSASNKNTSTGGNFALHKHGYSYYTSYGGQGRVELILELHRDAILGWLILTEGR